MPSLIVSATTNSLNKYAALSDREKVLKISAIIRYAEQKLKKKFPILNRQNLIGFSIFISSCAAFCLNTFLFLKGIMPAWMCFIGNAFCTSFLHELEHDLIHQLYFRARPFVQNTLMGAIWLFRGNLISPWYRRMIHLLHHRESGQKEDIEERLIGNGLPWGLKRLLLTVEPGLSILQFKDFHKQIPSVFSLKQILLATFPIFILFNVIWFSFLTNQGWKIINLIHQVVPPFPVWYVHLVNILMVVYVGPNILRQISLSLISSSCHYYGDVSKASVLQQTQVLQPWYLFPFQLFCFNFGSTHVIHHFVVNQPFYLRQMVAPLAHAAMKKYGIRFNDVGTFFRANRYSEAMPLAA
jgi:fatty acid desaturase